MIATTGGFFAHYDINDHARVYMEMQFMDDRTLAQIAPSGAFIGAGLADDLGQWCQHSQRRLGD